MDYVVSIVKIIPQRAIGNLHGSMVEHLIWTQKIPGLILCISRDPRQVPPFRTGNADCKRPMAWFNIKQPYMCSKCYISLHWLTSLPLKEHKIHNANMMLKINWKIMQILVLKKNVNQIEPVHMICWNDNTHWLHRQLLNLYAYIEKLGTYHIPQFLLQK